MCCEFAAIASAVVAAAYIILYYIIDMYDVCIML
jgi:hypothetical protein